MGAKISKISKPYLVPSPPLKKLVFSDKIKGMITPSMEMLELPSFGQMTTSITNLSYVIKFLGNIMDINFAAITFISK